MSSYYKISTFQKSAAEGAYKAQADAALVDEIIARTQGQGDGRISGADMQAIIQLIKDGGAYGKGEKAPTQTLLAARDDRKAVKINGTELRLTDKAEAIISKEMPKFWGSLGGKAAYAQGGGKHYELAIYNGTSFEKQSAADAAGMKGDQSRNPTTGQIRAKRGDAYIGNIAYTPKDLIKAFGANATVSEVRQAFGNKSYSAITKMSASARAATLAATQGSQQQSPAVQAVQAGA
jgi:hypothetical protein